jgi:hypothetical protein
MAARTVVPLIERCSEAELVQEGFPHGHPICPEPLATQRDGQVVGSARGHAENSASSTQALRNEDEFATGAVGCLTYVQNAVAVDVQA